MSGYSIARVIFPFARPTDLRRAKRDYIITEKALLAGNDYTFPIRQYRNTVIQ